MSFLICQEKIKFFVCAVSTLGNNGYDKQERGKIMQERETFFRALLTVIKWLLVAVAVLALIYGWIPTVFGAQTHYDLLVDAQIKGGELSLPTDAAEGENVSVTISAHPGYTYRQGSVRVVGADGTAYVCEEQGEGASFTMPAQAVTVYAEFAPVTYSLYFYIHPAVPYLPPEECREYRGMLYTTLTYTVEDAGTVELPVCPTIDGYEASWNWDPRLMSDSPGNYAVMARYREEECRITYTVQYLLAGKEQQAFFTGAPFSIGMFYGEQTVPYAHPAISIPGYGEVSSENLPGNTDFHTLYAASRTGVTVSLSVSDAIAYPVFYYAEGAARPLYAATYTVADANAFSVPELPEKEGFSGEWMDHPRNHAEGGELHIRPVYRKIPAVSAVTSEAGSTGPALDGAAWKVVLAVAAFVIMGAIGIRTGIAVLQGNKTVKKTGHGIEPIGKGGIRAVDADCRMSDSDAAAAVVWRGQCRSGRMAAVNLGTISRIFSDGETVSLETLRKHGVIGPDVQRCKILAGGELTKRHLTVEADAISLQAVKMVLLMEGKVVRLGEKSM